MRNFKIVPLTKEYSKKIKTLKFDDFGHPVIEQIASGFGPCRVSLKPFAIGLDERLLFSYSPFTIDNAFNQPGPIFIQKNDIEPYNDVYNFPKEIKSDKNNFPLSLIGYSKDQRMIFTKLVGDADVDDLIEQIFKDNKDIEYLHARNAEACCFICKIERI